MYSYLKLYVEFFDILSSDERRIKHVISKSDAFCLINWFSVMRYVAENLRVLLDIVGNMKMEADIGKELR